MSFFFCFCFASIDRHSPKDIDILFIRVYERIIIKSCSSSSWSGGHDRTKHSLILTAITNRSLIINRFLVIFVCFFLAFWRLSINVGTTRHKLRFLLYTGISVYFQKTLKTLTMCRMLTRNNVPAVAGSAITTLQ